MLQNNNFTITLTDQNMGTTVPLTGDRFLLLLPLFLTLIEGVRGMKPADLLFFLDTLRPPGVLPPAGVPISIIS